MVRMGMMMCRVSIIPDATCGSIGVNSRKLSSLTMTSSTSSAPAKYDSSFRAHSTPANPPPRISMRRLRGLAIRDRRPTFPP